MIYINDLILSSINSRINMATATVGSIYLSELELRALECHFPGVGIRWIDKSIVQIPACPFNLKVTEDGGIIFELENCIFVPIEEVCCTEDEMTKVSFIGKPPQEAYNEFVVGSSSRILKIVDRNGNEVDDGFIYGGGGCTAQWPETA